MNDFQLLLQAVLDSSSIGQSDIAKVQKVLNKYHLNLTADLDKAQLLKTVKAIVPELEAELKKTTGIDIKISDSAILKSIQQIGKEAEITASKVNKIQLSLDNGHGVSQYHLRIQELINDFQKYGISATKAQEETKALQQILSGMNGLSGQELVNQADKFEQEFKSVKISIDAAKQTYDKFMQPVSGEKITSLILKIQDFLNKNTRITREARRELDGYINELKGGNISLEKWNSINGKLKETESSMRSINKLGKSIKDQFAQAKNSFVQWTSVSTAIMAIIYQLRKIPTEVRELDNAITDFTMATGANKTQISELINTYADLGDELSATVIDVTTSATEWLKQGKSIAETETLIKDAMILSKVGTLSSADSTKYLTSAMKGYNVTAEETLSIVDKLSAVDMASATDVGGLAEGMSEVANNANLAGVSMDKLLGYLATVGEVTQSSMSEVGTSFNAIFSRMGNIKLARLKDYQNNGEDLSDVETVLRGEGINLRDEINSFRDFDEVLDEVAGRWNSFSEVSQRAIAKAFAGTNHMEDFLVLMNNYNTALDYTEISLNSSGQAMEKFEAYEDSVAGHTERLKNAFIQLSNNILGSDTLKSIIDSGTTIVSFLDKTIDKLGAIPILLSVIGNELRKNLGLD